MGIRLLLEHPSLAAECSDSVQPEFLNGSGIAGLNVLQDVFSFCASHPQAKTAQVVENFREHPYSKSLGRLLVQEHFIDETDAQRVFRDCFARLLEKQKAITEGTHKNNKTQLQGITSHTLTPCKKNNKNN